VIREATKLCTPERGPRPAGRPDECFYCRVKLGEEHKLDCVMRQRTIVARYEYEVVVVVPEHWTAENFEFHRNESTSCADNTLRELKTNAERRAELAKDPEPFPYSGCFCFHFKAKYLREATDGEDPIGGPEL
jgi:hypothetical protein